MSRLYSISIVLILLSLSFVSCNKVSFATKDFKQFEEELKQAQRKGEVWANSPSQIALKYHRYHDGASEFTMSQIKKNRGESLEKVELELTSEGILDDSVNGIKTKMTMELKRGNWEIKKIEEAYRCAEGRGQESYAADLCN